MTYTVTFVDNYSSGTKYIKKSNNEIIADQHIKEQKFTYAEVKPLNKNEFVKEGHTHAGWRMEVPETLVKGDPFFNLRNNLKPRFDFLDRENVQLTEGNNIYLFAEWKPNKVKIIYKYNKTPVYDAKFTSTRFQAKPDEIEYGDADLFFKPIKSDRRDFASWSTKSSLKQAHLDAARQGVKISGKKESYFTDQIYLTPTTSLTLYEQIYTDVCVHPAGKPFPDISPFNTVVPTAFYRLDAPHPQKMQLYGELVTINGNNKDCNEVNTYYNKYISPAERLYWPGRLTNWSTQIYGVQTKSRKEILNDALANNPNPKYVVVAYDTKFLEGKSVFREKIMGVLSTTKPFSYVYSAVDTTDNYLIDELGSTYMILRTAAEWGLFGSPRVDGIVRGKPIPKGGNNLKKQPKGGGVKTTKITKLGKGTKKGTVTKNKLNDKELAQAEEVVKLKGGHFEGQKLASTPGIDGHLGGTPVSLKEYTGKSPSGVLKHASKAEEQVKNAKLSNVDVYINAKEVSSDVVMDYAKNGPLMEIPKQGHIKDIYIQTADGWIQIH